jgi:hypothetical protein
MEIYIGMFYRGIVFATTDKNHQEKKKENREW